MSVKVDCRHQYPSGFQLQVSFETGDGCTALLGPSGCGKTTVLSIVSGMLKPDEGHVMIGGDVVVDGPQRIFVQPNHRHVGCVFQDALLFPHMDVKQNLQFGAQARQIKSRQIDLESVIDVLDARRIVGTHAARVVWRPTTTRLTWSSDRQLPPASVIGRTAFFARSTFRDARSHLFENPHSPNGTFQRST